jgi:hypothetical protein
MKNTKGRPFQPGNTFGRGRPQGSRNKATIALQEMLDGHGESITRKCALLALQGNPTALRLCMERLIAPRRDSPIKFNLPAVNTAAEVGQAIGTVLQDVAGGQLTPAEGQMVSAILEDRLKAIETEDQLRTLKPESEGQASSHAIELVMRLNAARTRINQENEIARQAEAAALEESKIIEP